MQEKRRQWVENIPKLDVNKIVFLDESGANTDMVRRYGRSRAKTRVVDHAPLNTPKSTTIVSSMRRNGATAFATLRGSMNGERFIAYLEETLIPTLEAGDYVVMDNLGSHHVKGVEERIRAAGAFPLYLPPYSPDLTPIEKLWSKVKAALRKKRVRSADLLPLAIADAFALVRPEDCAGWFAASGYS